MFIQSDGGPVQQTHTNHYHHSVREELDHIDPKVKKLFCAQSTIKGFWQFELALKDRRP